MKVMRRVITTTRRWPIRLLILLGVITLAVFSHSKQNLSAHAMDSASFSPAFDAGEVFGNVCLMPDAGRHQAFVPDCGQKKMESESCA